MKIRAAVVREIGHKHPFAKSQPISVEEIELGGPGPGEVLVEIAAAGLCHSDLSAVTGIRPRPVPYVPGHEAAGIVREIGPGVTRVAPGDHAVLYFVPSCGNCPACDRGEPFICDTAYQARSAGGLVTGSQHLSRNDEVINHFSGVSCYAEYAVLAEASVIRIDKDIPLEDAALFGCAVITGVGSVVNTAQLPAGATVAVIGLGGVGLNAMFAAILSGAERIIAIDINDERLALARQLGATDTVNAASPDCVGEVREMTGGGVDYAFELAGVPAALETAWALCRRGGTLVTAGLPAPDATLSVPITAMVDDAKTLKGCYMGGCVPRRDIPRFLSLYRRNKIPVDKLLSGFLNLEGLNEGFDRLADGKVIRQILRPGAAL